MSRLRFSPSANSTFPCELQRLKVRTLKNWVIFLQEREKTWTEKLKKRTGTDRRMWSSLTMAKSFSTRPGLFWETTFLSSLHSYIDPTKSATWAKFRQRGVDQYLRYSCLIETKCFTPTFIIHKTSIVTRCSDRGSCQRRTSMGHGQMFIPGASFRLIIAHSSTNNCSIMK